MVLRRRTVVGSGTSVRGCALVVCALVAVSPLARGASSVSQHAGQPVIPLAWPFEEREVGAAGWHETPGSPFHRGFDHHAQDWNYKSGSADRDPDLGKAVLSASDGTVVLSGDRGTCYGKEVVVRFTVRGRELFIRYAHLDSIDPTIEAGAVVTPGTHIGRVGRSGSGRRCGTWSAHLHVSLYGRFPPRAETDGLPFEFVQGRPTVYLADASVSPAQAHAGAAIDFVYRVANPTDTTVTLRLGASIRPTGTKAWIDDPARDKLVTIGRGSVNVSRRFLLPTTLEPGVYDVAWTLVEEKSKAWLARREDLRILQVSGPKTTKAFSFVIQTKAVNSGQLEKAVVTVSCARTSRGIGLKITIRALTPEFTFDSYGFLVGDFTLSSLFGHHLIQWIVAPRSSNTFPNFVYVGREVPVLSFLVKHLFDGVDFQKPFRLTWMPFVMPADRSVTVTFPGC